MPIGQTPCTERFLRLRAQAAAQPARRIDAGQPVWVFGAGHFGRALARAMQAQGLAVAGFVETTPQAPEVQGLPVLDWPTLARTAPHAQLALGILNHRAPYDQLVAIATQAGFPPPDGKLPYPECRNRVAIPLPKIHYAGFRLFDETIQPEYLSPDHPAR